MKLKQFFTLVILLILSTALSAVDVAELVKPYPAKQTESYSYDLTKPVTSRIFTAPDILLKYLNELDSKDAYRPYTLTKEEHQLFADYYSLLPAKFKKVMTDNLIGIYFIKNFASGGMTDFVIRKDGKMFLILVINSDVMQKSLQEWISFRDNSSFSGASDIAITNKLGNKYKGLLHTLVHESSHIYDFYNRITPYTDPGLKELGMYSFQKTPFIKDIWLSYDRPVQKYNFKNRNLISTYGFGKPLDKSAILDIYRDLSGIPFASLYSGKSWAEDYAELFTWYFLSAKLHITYNPEIVSDNKSVFTYDPFANDEVIKRFGIFADLME